VTANSLRLRSDFPARVEKHGFGLVIVLYSKGMNLPLSNTGSVFLASTILM
jgi:hypothetical protein